MSLQVEKLEGNMAKLTIEASAEDFEAAIEKAYQKNKGKLSIYVLRLSIKGHLEEDIALVLGTNKFLHPHHIVPAAELPSATVEMPHHGKPHPLVEEHAIVRKMRVILPLGVRYASTHALESALAQFALECLVKHAPYAALPLAALHIDAGFHRPAESLAPLELCGIGISRYPAFLLCHQIGVLAQNARYAPFKLLQGGHIVFKGDGGFLHVWCVYLQQAWSIGRSCFAYIYHRCRQIYDKYAILGLIVAQNRYFCRKYSSFIN